MADIGGAWGIPLCMNLTVLAGTSARLALLHTDLYVNFQYNSGVYYLCGVQLKQRRTDRLGDSAALPHTSKPALALTRESLKLIPVYLASRARPAAFK